MSNTNVTIELVEKYLALTEEARSKATPIANGDSEEERLVSTVSYTHLTLPTKA